jgi:uncharacterized protein YggE
MRCAVLIAGTLASALIAPAAAGAQTTAPAVNALPVSAPAALPYPAISATATASRDFVPDIARVAVIIDATAPAAVAALTAVRTKEQALRNAVAPAVITLSGLSVQYDRGSGSSGPRITVSETASTQVDVARVAPTVDAIHRFGANVGVSFDTTRHEELYREALAEATSLAYGRVVAMAGAAKADIDRITFVDAGLAAQSLDAQNAILNRISGGPLATLAALLGSPADTTIHATVIVTARLR